MNYIGKVRRFLALRQNGWIFFFFVILGGWHWHAMQAKESTYSDLKLRIHSVEENLWTASQERDELVRQIGSQSDPEWIELVLMKRLGLVPQGQTKVYFEKTQP